jgi:carboxypeptidase family protein
VRRVLFITVTTIVFAAMMTAQITGDLKGTVLDSSNAAVPNAKMTLVSVETGETRHTSADAEGRFAFGLLKIGSYDIKTEVQGFRPANTRVNVRAGEISSLRFVLEVGQVTETLQVTDAATAVDVENAQIQVSIEGPKIQDLPVARNPNLFALTSAGVTPVSSNNPFLSSGSFNANGGRGRANNITVDNITSTDIQVTGTSGPLGPLSFSQIKEVKIITNNFNAEYGRNSSAQVLYITQSGTNQLHGDLYDYFQNDKLNARSFFDRSGRRDIVRANQYGFAVGGPVWLGKLYDGRNKTHFFTTWEGTKVRGAGTARIANVPSPVQLSQVTDPTARELLQRYQLPAATSIGAESGTVQQAAGTLGDGRQWSARVDHQLTSRDTLTGKYAGYVVDSGDSSLTFLATNLANFGARATNTPRQASLSETHVFSPSLVNEARFGFGRSVPVFTIDSTVPLGPRIRFLNAQIDFFGVAENMPQGRVQNTFQLTDTASWNHGAHTVKAGADLYRYQANSFFDNQARGRFDFANWDDFAAGRPSRYDQIFGSSVRGHRVTNHFYFLQDDWKASRSLTLNFGLRVEVAGGVSEVNGKISNLDLNCHDSMGAAGTGAFGCFSVGQPAFENNVNWGPRFGFAWTPFRDAKTVVRGGYGITYDFMFLNAITNQRFLPPFAIPASIAGVGSFSGANSFANLVAGTAAIQQQGRADVGRINPLSLNYGNVSPAIDSGIRNPQVQQFSLGVEREIAHVVLKASYVGTKGTYLQRSRPLNLINDPRARPATSLADETARLQDFTAVVAASAGNAARQNNRIDPRFNDILWFESSANSVYHSFQFEADKRFAQSYLVRAAYTYGKSIDDVSDGLGVLINDSHLQQNPGDNRNNRGVSQFDIGQRLVIMHQWEPVWGKGIANGFLRRVVHGWGFSGITSFRSGFPVTIETGPRRGVAPLTLLGTPATTPVRPNATGAFAFNPVPTGSAGSPNGLNSDVQRVSAYAASLGLSQPLIGNFGNLGRNSHRLNGERNFDWNVYKNVPISETVKLQLRAEFYNMFNNTSFQDVVRNIGSGGFGQYTTVGQNSRAMQVAARLVF